MERILQSLHRTIFHKEMGEVMSGFLQQAAWSTIGGGLAAAILLAANIIAGRLLGAQEYGKFNIILAVAQPLYIFFLFGIDIASLRIIPRLSSLKDKARHVSTAFYSVLLISLGGSLIFWLLSPWFGQRLGLDGFLLPLALVYSLLLCFRQLLDTLIRSVEQFRLQATMRMTEAIVVLAVLSAGIFYFHDYSFVSYAMALLVGGIVLILAYLYALRSFFAPFSVSAWREQITFAKVAFLATILGMIFAPLDKILIGHFLHYEQVGVYSAYYTASFLVAAQLSVLFDTVFFPFVTKHVHNLREITRKIDRLSLVSLPVLFIGMAAIITLAITLFGSQYTLRPGYVISFALLAVAKIIFSVNASLITIHSKKALKISMYLGNTSNVLFIGGYYLLAVWGLFSLQAVVALLVIYHLVAIGICKYAQHRVVDFYG